MRRRSVLQALALGAAWPAASSLTAEFWALGAEIHAATNSQTGAAGAFDPAAAATVSAACDRILPADDTPGALAAGVPGFIATVMTGWESAADRDRWLAGVATLDERARTRHGRGFAACETADQDALLASFESEVQALPAERRAGHWFARLRYLTIYGYCTSEVGLRQGLKEELFPGRYDGDAPYGPGPLRTPTATREG